jgi:MYXO-CTERM domain-containing protein
MRIRPLLSALIFLGFPATAAAAPDRPVGIYIPVEPAEPGAGDVAETHTSNIIYLDACWGGCTITDGSPDDSRINQSSIVSGTRTIGEFAHGQATWDAVVRCVREIFEPYDFRVVDQNPGNVSHFKSIVAGRPGEIGQPNWVGGVAPFRCGGIINNSINYTFANHYSGSVRQICETVAQETAHVFGLDHQYYCPDPMTYLGGCGPKYFRDYNAPCGEDSARTCCSGAQTQNSHARILGHFGPSQPSPPDVTITAPENGADVTPGFVVRADAVDDVHVDRVELWINGSRIMGLSSLPYVFNAPLDIPKGTHTVEVRAWDNRDDMGSASITVNVGDPCTKPADCSNGDTCVGGRCVAGPGTPGGLGELCVDGTECLSGLCGFDGTENRCVEDCTPGGDDCPSDFTCLSAGSTGVCWPAEGGAGCGGCAGGNGSPAAPLALALLVALIAFRPRRSA